MSMSENLLLNVFECHTSQWIWYDIKTPHPCCQFTCFCMRFYPRNLSWRHVEDPRNQLNLLQVRLQQTLCRWPMAAQMPGFFFCKLRFFNALLMSWHAMALLYPVLKCPALLWLPAHFVQRYPNVCLAIRLLRKHLGARSLAFAMLHHESISKASAQTKTVLRRRISTGVHWFFRWSCWFCALHPSENWQYPTISYPFKRRQKPLPDCFSSLPCSEDLLSKYSFLLAIQLNQVCYRSNNLSTLKLLGFLT